MEYIKAFIIGGAICLIGQILIDKTKLTPAKILTGFVVAGVILTAVGVYKPLVDWAGAGATVPLSGFGYALAEGAKKAVAEKGPMGALSGPIAATAAGISAAAVFGFIASIISKPKDKA